jgi:hypothetical protein
MFQIILTNRRLSILKPKHDSDFIYKKTCYISLCNQNAFYDVNLMNQQFWWIDIVIPAYLTNQPIKTPFSFSRRSVGFGHLRTQ